MTRRLRRLIKDVSGANLVEAAVATPLVLLLTFAVADFASLFFVYLALEHGVTEATRAGVTGTTAGAREATLIQAMRAATPALTIPDSAVRFSHLAPGGSSWLAGAGGPDDIDKITVDYSWRLLTPVLRPLFSGGAVHIRVESSRKNEWRFE